MNSNKKGRIQRPPTSIFKSENTDEIASYEISKYYTHIHSNNLKEVKLQKVYGNRKIIECICHTVSETADYEKWYTEKERKIILLARESHCSCHYESATYSQKTATESSVLKSDFQYLLCCSLKFEI